PGMLSVDSLLARNWAIFWDVIRHLILPVITLTTVLNAGLIMVTRGSMIEALNQDYVRTAKAKGLSERDVNLKHARRNALLPVAT
ncbi:ABC transporter permease, partial [Escherichia coli]|nr:ABC transporter permease [Escherichia coli]